MSPKDVFQTIDTDSGKITELFSEPLITKSDTNSVKALRKQISDAEVMGIIIVNNKRKLSQLFDIAKMQALDEIKTKEGAESFDTDKKKKGLTVDEKKVMIESRTSKYNAYAEYLSDIQDMIKRRVTLGQSFLNSIRSELDSSFNNRGE